MKTTLAFDEPPSSPRRSITPAGFPATYSLGAPLPPFLFDDLLADQPPDPLRRLRAGVAPLPSPQPRLEELLATLSEKESRSATLKAMPFPEIGAIAPELRAAWGIVDAVELLRDASWRLFEAEDPTHTPAASAVRTKEAMTNLREDRANLDRIAAYLLDLSSCLFADPDSTPAPPRPAAPALRISPERKQAVQRPTAGAVLPSQTKPTTGAVTQQKKAERKP